MKTDLQPEFAEDFQETGDLKSAGKVDEDKSLDWRKNRLIWSGICFALPYPNTKIEFPNVPISDYLLKLSEASIELSNVSRLSVDEKRRLVLIAALKIMRLDPFNMTVRGRRSSFCLGTSGYTLWIEKILTGKLTVTDKCRFRGRALLWTQCRLMASDILEQVGGPLTTREGKFVRSASETLRMEADSVLTPLCAYRGKRWDYDAPEMLSWARDLSEKTAISIWNAICLYSKMSDKDKSMFESVGLPATYMEIEELLFYARAGVDWYIFLAARRLLGIDDPRALSAIQELRYSSDSLVRIAAGKSELTD